MKFREFFRKINKIRLNLLKRFRRMRLHNTNFTIISNNCWAGFIYQHYGLPYCSPTIGIGIVDEHYMKFIKNLKYYMSQPLVFINPQSANFYEFRKQRNEGKEINYPVARLDDIEIYFTHYKDEKSAREKWEKRKSRINWNCIIYKWSQRNGANDDTIKEFVNTEGVKVAFVEPKTTVEHECLIKIPEFSIYKWGGGDETPATLKHWNATKNLNKLVREATKI